MLIGSAVAAAAEVAGLRRRSSAPRPADVDDAEQARGAVRRQASTRRPRALPRRWHVVGAWVTLKKNPTGRVHVLGWVDEKTYKPGEKLAMGVEHPVAWCRELGDGRAFTTTLGLDAATSGSSRVFRRHLAGAIALRRGHARRATAARRSGRTGSAPSSTTDITDGTQLDVGPDGRVYYLERTALDAEDLRPRRGHRQGRGRTSRRCRASARGCSGLAVDPNFNKTRWVYIYCHVEGLTGAAVALHARRQRPGRPALREGAADGSRTPASTTTAAAWRCGPTATCSSPSAPTTCRTSTASTARATRRPIVGPGDRRPTPSRRRRTR